MIYLACPYTHPDPAVRQHRFREACRSSAALIRAGHVVFCPIVHSHPLVEFDLPTDWQSWERIDREFLRRCDEIVVLMLEGWETSAGVRAELAFAAEVGLPVHFLESDLANSGGPNDADPRFV